MIGSKHHSICIDILETGVRLASLTVAPSTTHYETDTTQTWPHAGLICCFSIISFDFVYLVLASSLHVIFFLLPLRTTSPGRADVLALTAHPTIWLLAAAQSPLPRGNSQDDHRGDWESISLLEGRVGALESSLNHVV